MEYGDRAAPFEHSYLAMAKQVFDVTCAAAGLLLLWPFFLAAAVWIKLDSPGPVFYRGVRIGWRGRPFRIFKFRTMVEDAEIRGSTATAHGDPRITRAGKRLRPYKLDELPQLLNVMRGEMSIVGPRPEVEEHTSCYTGPEKIILTVKPGITDEASIRFYNLNELLGVEDPNGVFIKHYRAEKNRLRVSYVERRSFWGDLGIIFRTFHRLLVRP